MRSFLGVSFLDPLGCLGIMKLFVKCHEAIYVGYGSAVAYGVIIPCFLVFLIVKQNMALAANRRCVCWWVKENEGKKAKCHYVPSI